MKRIINFFYPERVSDSMIFGIREKRYRDLRVDRISIVLAIIAFIISILK